MNFKIVLIAIVFCCCSCAQLSLFQDAKTLGKGNASTGGHISGYGILDTDGSDDITLPSIVVHGSLGVTERVDLQLSVSFIGSFLLAPKVQILGNKDSKWALALNPGIEAHVGRFLGEEVGIFRTQYSAIGSFHPNDKVSLFIEPRYINQYRNDQANDVFYGSTLGINFKTKSPLDWSIAASFYDVKSSPELLYQLGFGLCYKFVKN